MNINRGSRQIVFIALPYMTLHQCICRENTFWKKFEKAKFFESDGLL